MTKKRSSRGALLLVLVVLLAAIVAAGVLWPRGANQVTFVGDSITDQMRGPAERRFRVNDDFFKAVPGKTIRDMTEAAQGLANTNAKHAIINLGTNDVLQGFPPGQSAAQLVELAGLYSNATCVHLVTVNERMVSPNGSDVYGPAVALNNAMRAWAAEAPAKRKVIDWAKIVIDYDAAGKPEGALTIDTVHPTALGEQKLLDAYQQSLDACAG